AVDSYSAAKVILSSTQISGIFQSRTITIEFGHECVETSTGSGLKNPCSRRQIGRVALASDVSMAHSVECYRPADVGLIAAKVSRIHQRGTSAVDLGHKRVICATGIRSLKGSRSLWKIG